MKYFQLFIAALLLISCTKPENHQQDSSIQFSSELDELKDYFKIPGLAVSVIHDGKVVYKEYKGVADVENGVSLDSTYQFPIASLTKIFSGVAIMQLVEKGKLSLDDPLKKYFSESAKMADSILIKHVLSHTSQGDVGKKFYYSSRFGLLTRVIEQASEMSFEEYMKTHIFNPLELKNTYLLKDSAQMSEQNLKIAKPYVLDNGVEKGFIDFGFSTSAGIVSDLNDLQRFSSVLDQNQLISEASREQLYTGINPKLPYGYGIFKQEIHGVQVVWGYGQYDCYSSLFLKVPEKNLTLILLANNNLMSDPARLIYGDISYSLFAMSFLKNYVFNLEEMNLLEQESQEYTSEFHRDKLLAQALSESFIARFDLDRMQKSSDLLKTVFDQYPNYLEYADLSLLHNLIFLKDVAFYRELGEFNTFDEHIIKIGAKLLKDDPENPYLNIYFGNYYARKGDQKRAKYYYEQITKVKNFSRNWYTSEAINGLKSLEQ